MGATTVVVENDSGTDGLATRVSSALMALGYQVGTPTDGAIRSRTQLVDRTGQGAAPLAQQLAKDVGLESLNVVDAVDVSSANEVVLQLGTDEVNAHVAATDDKQAPFSVTGVVKFGVWPWNPGPTSGDTVLPTPTGRVRELPTPTPHPVQVAGDPNQVIVPSLVGLAEAEAQRVINESGLMTTYVNYQTASQVGDRAFFKSIAPGAVLSQIPPAGTRVPRGTRVALAVRKP
jgi:hypothetical protein